MSALPETHAIFDAAGRRITWCEYGDPNGRFAIAAHGTPGSRYQGIPLHEPAAAAGWRLIFPDRPGYGRTSPLAGTASPDPGFHDWDDDALAILDHLGADKATLLGFSGGGGYALALAARFPARVERLVLVCAMIPGTPRKTLRRRIHLVSALYAAARWAPGLAGAMLAGTGVFAHARRNSVSAWPVADQAVMNDPVAKKNSDLDGHEARTQGTAAAVTDLRRYDRELPEPLESITVPTVFLHGSADGNVPIEVARRAHERIPGSVFETVAGAGHLFLAQDPAPLLRVLR
ncbi:alpha/beta fold hydrolase [Amycolatopsis samaneae]|uniref:Alpha/beta fold hydrolase n=1 Tax=Amycolatopsis samaneae TaxID=664691 RepID=A0ABW5GFY4_9PSEU